MLGDPVNLAAKLEKHTKAERTAGIVMADTYELACAQGFTPRLDWQLRRDREVSGVSRTVDIWVY